MVTRSHFHLADGLVTGRSATFEHHVRCHERKQRLQDASDLILEPDVLVQILILPLPVSSEVLSK